MHAPHRAPDGHDAEMARGKGCIRPEETELVAALHKQHHTGVRSTNANNLLLKRRQLDAAALRHGARPHRPDTLCRRRDGCASTAAASTTAAGTHCINLQTLSSRFLTGALGGSTTR
jgi:hypothetical protein